MGVGGPLGPLENASAACLQVLYATQAWIRAEPSLSRIAQAVDDAHISSDVQHSSSHGVVQAVAGTADLADAVLPGCNAVAARLTKALALLKQLWPRLRLV